MNNTRPTKPVATSRSTITEWKLWVTTGLGVVFTLTWMALQKPTSAADSSVSMQQLQPVGITDSLSTEDTVPTVVRSVGALTTAQTTNSAVALPTPTTRITPIRRTSSTSSTRAVRSQPTRIRTRSS